MTEERIYGLFTTSSKVGCGSLGRFMEKNTDSSMVNWQENEQENEKVANPES